MAQSIVHVTVKLVVEHPDDISKREACDLAVTECDYSFKFSDDGVKIVDTEIVDIEEKF